MSRQPRIRIALGDIVYHVLNRGNGCRPGMSNGQVSLVNIRL